MVLAEHSHLEKKLRIQKMFNGEWRRSQSDSPGRAKTTVLNWVLDLSTDILIQPGPINVRKILDKGKTIILEQLAKVLGIHTGSEIADNVLFDIIKSHLSAVLTTCIDESDDEGMDSRLIWTVWQYNTSPWIPDESKNIQKILFWRWVRWGSRCPLWIQ